MTIRRFAAGVLAVGMMVSLSACGNDASTTSSAHANGSSAAASGDAGAGNAAAGDAAAGDAGTITPESFTQQVLAAQRDGVSAHVEATIAASGQSGSISGDFAGGRDASALRLNVTADFAGRQVELRYAGKVLYIKGAGMSTDTAKPWVKVDLSGAHNPLAPLFASANPENFTKFLQGLTSIDDRGTETVDGVRAHHYAVTIDTAKMMKANAMMKGHDASMSGMPRRITGQVWLNSDNLPVKISVPFGDMGSFEAHFSKYGERVSVDAPPASQVSQFSL